MVSSSTRPTPGTGKATFAKDDNGLPNAVISPQASSANRTSRIFGRISSVKDLIPALRRSQKVSPTLIDASDSSTNLKNISKYFNTVVTTLQKEGTTAYFGDTEANDLTRDCIIDFLETSPFLDGFDPKTKQSFKKINFNDNSGQWEITKQAKSLYPHELEVLKDIVGQLNHYPQSSKNTFKQDYKQVKTLKFKLLLALKNLPSPIKHKFLSTELTQLIDQYKVIKQKQKHLKNIKEAVKNDLPSFLPRAKIEQKIIDDKGHEHTLVTEPFTPSTVLVTSSSGETQEAPSSEKTISSPTRQESVIIKTGERSGTSKKDSSLSDRHDAPASLHAVHVDDAVTYIRSGQPAIPELRKLLSGTPDLNSALERSKKRIFVIAKQFQKLNNHEFERIAKDFIKSGKTENNPHFRFKKDDSGNITVSYSQVINTALDGDKRSLKAIWNNLKKGIGLESFSNDHADESINFALNELGVDALQKEIEEKGSIPIREVEIKDDDGTPHKIKVVLDRVALKNYKLSARKPLGDNGCYTMADDTHFRQKTKDYKRLLEAWKVSTENSSDTPASKAKNELLKKLQQAPVNMINFEIEGKHALVNLFNENKDLIKQLDIADQCALYYLYWQQTESMPFESLIHGDDHKNYERFKFTIAIGFNQSLGKAGMADVHWDSCKSGKDRTGTFASEEWNMALAAKGVFEKSTLCNEEGLFVPYKLLEASIAAGYEQVSETTNQKVAESAQGKPGLKTTGDMRLLAKTYGRIYAKQLWDRIFPNKSTKAEASKSSKAEEKLQKNLSKDIKNRFTRVHKGKPDLPKSTNRYRKYTPGLIQRHLHLPSFIRNRINGLDSTNKPQFTKEVIKTAQHIVSESAAAEYFTESAPPKEWRDEKIADIQRKVGAPVSPKTQTDLLASADELPLPPQDTNK